MLTILTTTLLLLPLCTFSLDPEIAREGMRLIKRDNDIPSRIRDLNEQLKRSKPYVVFELAATANDELAHYFDVENCMSKGYNGTQVRVYRPDKNTPLNTRRACQQFVLHPQLFVTGENSYSIGLSSASEPYLFNTQKNDQTITLSAPDPMWIDGQIFKVECFDADKSTLDPNKKDDRGRRYFGRKCRISSSPGKCLAALNFDPDQKANQIKAAYTLTNVDCDQQLKAPAQIWNIRNVACNYDNNNHVPGQANPPDCSA